MTEKIILTLLIIALPILIITASIDSIIFTKENYLKYENQLENKEEIIINLLDYFKNNKKLIEQEEFTHDEKEHFLDVKNLIRTIKSILLISILLTSMLLINLFTKIKKRELKDKLSVYLIKGSSITIILIFLYVIAIIISSLITALYIGKLMVKKKKLILPMLAGGVVLIILSNLPFIGGFVKFLALLLGLGAITLAIFSKKKKGKK